MDRDMPRHPPPAVDGHIAQPREAPTTAPGTRSPPHAPIPLPPAHRHFVLPVAKRAAAAWDVRLRAHCPAQPLRLGSPQAPLAPLADAARSPSLLPLQSRSRPASGSPAPRPPAFPAIKTINPASSAPRLPGAAHTFPHPHHAHRQRCPPHPHRHNHPHHPHRLHLCQHPRCLSPVVATSPVVALRPAVPWCPADAAL